MSVEAAYKKREKIGNPGPEGSETAAKTSQNVSRRASERIDVPRPTGCTPQFFLRPKGAEAYSSAIKNRERWRGELPHGEDTDRPKHEDHDPRERSEKLEGECNQLAKGCGRGQELKGVQKKSAKSGGRGDAQKNRVPKETVCPCREKRQRSSVDERPG